MAIRGYRTSIRTWVLALTLGAVIPAFAAPVDPSAPPSDLDKKELKAWGGRYRSDFGALLTPPKGHISPGIKQAQQYVQNMVNEVAGDRFRESGIRVIVNLYSGASPNAAASQPGGLKQGSSTDASGWAEAKWQEDHPGELWPIRRLIGYDKDKKPVYELLFSAGLFRLIKTDSELAFIIGHEATHILAKHVKPGETLNELTQNAIAAQAHEVEADLGAVDLILGKYDLEGAIGAIEKLSALEKNDKRTTLQALTAFGENHHHEGVRIGALQSRIEQLRNSDPRALEVTESHDLPSYLKSHVPDRRFTAPNAFQKEAEAQVLKTVTEEFLEKEDPLSNFEDSKVAYGFMKRQKLQGNFNNTQLNPALTKALDLVSRSSLSPERKMESVMATLFLFRKLSSNLLPALSLENYSKLELLIDKISRQPGFSIDHFLEKLSSKDLLQSTGTSLQDLLGPTPLRGIFGALATKNPVWRKGVSLMMSDLIQNKGKFDPYRALVLYKNHLSKASFYYQFMPFDQKVDGKTFTEDKLYNVSLQAIENQIRSKEFTDRLTEQRLTGDPMYVWSDRIWRGILEKYGSEVPKDLLNEVGPQFAHIAEWRNLYIARIRKDPSERFNMGALFSTVLPSHRNQPLSPDQLKALKSILRGMANRQMNKDLTYGLTGLWYGSQQEGTSTQPSVQPIEAEWLLSQVAKDPALSENDRLTVLKFMALLTTKGNDFSLSLPYDSELRANLIQAFHAIPKDRLFQWVASTPPSIAHKLQSLMNDLADTADRAELERLREALQTEAGNTHENSKKYLEILTRTQSHRVELREFRDYSAQSNLGAVTLLTLADGGTGKFAREFDFSDLQRLTSSAFASMGDWIKARSDSWKNKTVSIFDETPKLSPDSGLFLFKILRVSETQAPNLETWYQQFERIYRSASGSLDKDPSLTEAYEAFLKERFSRENPSVAYKYLKKRPVFEILSTDTKIQLLKRYLDSVLNPKMSESERTAQVRRTIQELGLDKRYPDVYDAYKKEMASHLNLQPGNVKKYFPEQGNTVVENSENFSWRVRGLSQLVALTRPESFQDQMDMIDYLMGRRKEMPEFIFSVARGIDPKFPVSDKLRTARDRIARETTPVRVFVVNSFLAGPSSLLNKPDEYKKMVEYILRGVRPENQEIAHEMTDALVTSMGSSKSLAFAYVLGQKPEPGKDSIDEGQMLRSVFEAFGTAGVKLGQYLGFTSALAGYQDALRSLQDSAMPISYFDALDLINKRFDGNWPDNLEIKKIIGSGSVNIAVEYVDKSGEPKSEVISILRDKVEQASKYDFIRLKKFVAKLTVTPEGERKYGFLHGLLGIIQRSVTLEFNKENALEIQRGMKDFYDRPAKGPDDWTLKTLDAYDAKNGAVFMEKGQGVTARRLLEPGSPDYNPGLYKDAMRKLGRVELDGLLGIDKSGDPRPVPMIANPDFHDGQVLIDVKNRTVTILDFGQALKITNQEREWGIDLLSAISLPSRFAESSAKAINRMYRQASGHQGTLFREIITPSELTEILNSGDQMNSFIRVLSVLERRGFEVPLSTIHWVLAINRQVELGKKVGVPIEAEMMNLLIARRSGAGLAGYNFLHEFHESLGRFSDALRGNVDCLRRGFQNKLRAP